MESFKNALYLLAFSDESHNDKELIYRELIGLVSGDYNQLDFIDCITEYVTICFNNKGKIEDIKGDKQNQDVILDNEKYFLLEGEARERFRKWDNVKYIAERPKNKMMPKKSYDNKNWGMEIKTNNRLDPKDGIGIRFGVVVTLKEINGVNRIDEFIKNCTLNGWLVNKIDVQTRVDINKKVNEDIEFE